MASIKRQFILNLNQFRNTHYRTLNNAKIDYKNKMESVIDKITYPYTNKIVTLYKVYQGSNRRFDIGNVCCIHQKFFEDALVELGKLPDDNSEYIPMVIYMDGEVDKDNPRVEIELIDLTKENISYIIDIISTHLEQEVDS